MGKEYLRAPAFTGQIFRAVICGNGFEHLSEAVAMAAFSITMAAMTASLVFSGIRTAM